MLIDLSKVRSKQDGCMLINDNIVIDQTYYENTDIRSLSEVRVEGSITSCSDETYSLKLNIKGEMTLPCSITLVDVIYPFDIKIEEIIKSNDEENEDYLKIINNTLDIMPIIWQNIVVEIPMRIVSPNLEGSKLEGNGWKLLTEEEKMKELDPRLEKLRDLLKD